MGKTYKDQPRNHDSNYELEKKNIKNAAKQKKINKKLKTSTIDE